MARPASDTDGCLPLPELALRARTARNFKGLTGLRVASA